MTADWSSKKSFNSSKLRGKLESESELGEYTTEDPKALLEKAKIEYQSNAASKKLAYGYKEESALYAFGDMDGNLRTFSTFEAANNFAGETNAFWVDATHQDGYVTLYKGAFYAKSTVVGRTNYNLTAGQNVLLNVAHETFHHYQAQTSYLTPSESFGLENHVNTILGN
jgi:hypothetical protein